MVNLIYLAEKLKSEIQKAYNVLNNDIREKKAKDEGTRGKASQERMTNEPREGLKEGRHTNRAKYSSSSTNQDVSPSSRAGDLAAPADFPRATGIDQDNFHVVEGTDMPTKDFSLLRV